MKILFVSWIDAKANIGWIDKDSEDLGIDQCSSVGFLVKETEEYLSLAAAVSGEQFNAIISIPKPWIKKREELACP